MKELMPTGKKTEKIGTLLTNVSMPEKKTDSEMLEQIDGKLDLLLAERKIEAEG